MQDIFVGNGTTGPFTLSWNNIQLGTENVLVNQVLQLRNLDYTLDSVAGTVTFTHSLPASSAIEVTYTLIPAQSQRSGGGQTIPLSVDLLRNQSGYFSLDALGKQAPGTQNNLTLGAGLGWKGGPNNQLSSRFVYTPALAAGTDADADRTGMSLSGSAGAGKWGLFSMGFSRAGAGMDPNGDSSFQAGRQLLTLGSTLTPIKTVQAQFSFSRSEATDDTGNAATDAALTNSSLALTVTPTDKTKMQANLTQADTGPSGTTQTLALSVDSQTTKTMQVSAAFNDQNLPGAASDSQAINLKTVLTPSKTYSVQTSADQSHLGTTTTDQQSVTLALTPKSALQVNAGFLMRQTSVAGSADAVGTSEASVGATVHPLSTLEVSGSYKSRMAPDSDSNPNDLFDTSTACVSYAPLKTFKLTGTYAQNPDDSTDTLQRLARKGVGLQTNVGCLGLSGGCDWSRTYGTPDVEQIVHADLGLRFSAATQLSVGYQTQQNMLDPTVPLATAYTVGFTHTLGDRFSLSLSGKREQTAAATTPDYNATASLGMKF
ncbi:MAG: hypothetical protein ACRYFS_04020 [Janthinobacterium lividum]